MIETLNNKTLRGLLLSAACLLCTVGARAQKSDFDKACEYWSQTKNVSEAGVLPARGWILLPHDHIASTPMDSNRRNRVARVLFIGNSYTFYNNMPELVDHMATSQSDTLIYYAHAIPGNTFKQHYENFAVREQLSRKWDFVILQGNSRESSQPWDIFAANTLPYVKKLDSLFHASNPKGKTILYMTWGHKRGDEINCITNQEVCTYEKMSAKVRERYLLMRDTLQSWVAPVGSVWRNFRRNHPDVNLYVEDNFHPTYAGSFLIASTIYTTIFGKPLHSAFHGQLNEPLARSIGYEAGFDVLDSLNFWKINSAYHHSSPRIIAPIPNSIHNAKGFRLWMKPNPARTEIRWSITPTPVQTSQYRVQIVNSLGIVVMEKIQRPINGIAASLGTEFTFSLRNLPKGSYFFVVQFGKQRLSSPFVKL